MTALVTTNPTRSIDLGFERYLAVRKADLGRHLVDGTPDYTFDLDRELLRDLSTFAPVRWAAQSLTSFAIPLYRQLLYMGAVAVGPDQFPRVYGMAEHCARTLGIGVPQVFVFPMPMPNAFTLAFDDREPLVVVGAGLANILSDDELLAVIGHECGHIHCHHGIYHTMVVLVTGPALDLAATVLPGVVIWLLKNALRFFLAGWSRAAELSCDRAGVICSGGGDAAARALAGIYTGGDRLGDVNLEALARQTERVQSTPARFLELFRSHPILAKRVEAIRLFNQCRTLFDWLPDRRRPGPVLSRLEVDEQCRQFIGATTSGYRVG
jgi:Zn-dependent protease with chaperone function